MKKIFSTVVAAASLLAVSANANAQKGFYAGVHGAPQLSVMFNADDVDKPGADYKSKFSGAVGIAAGYQFAKNAGVGTEVRYSVTKQRYIADNGNYTQQFNYLKVPLLFTFNTDPAAVVMFTAKAGPQVGILLKSKITEADNHSLNGETTNRYRHLVAGVAAGAGVRVHVIGNIAVEAGLRFDGSVMDTEKKKHVAYEPGRANTYDLNGGVDVGIRYTFN